MHRWILMLGLLLCSGPVFAQAASTDSQTLQALLAEVRQLRMDLRNTTAAAQRAQILLYRLQAQEALVAHASQRLDDARLKFAQTQDANRHLAVEVKRNEDILGHGEGTPTERNQIQEMLPPLKARLESLQTEEQQRQANQMEAENQLRVEQVKLSELQDQLDRLQTTLDSLGQGATGNSR
jgi:hypothetical protein